MLTVSFGILGTSVSESLQQLIVTLQTNQGGAGGRAAELLPSGGLENNSLNYCWTFSMEADAAIGVKRSNKPFHLS